MRLDDRAGRIGNVIVNITAAARPAHTELVRVARLIDRTSRGGLGYHAARMAPLDYRSALWGSRRGVYVRGRCVRRGYVQIGSPPWQHREHYRAAWRRITSSLAAAARLHRDLGLTVAHAAQMAARAVAEFEATMRRAGEASRRARP